MISASLRVMSITMMSTKNLIVILGPTGSGKSDVSIDVARHFGAEIISTDSRQFYREIPIGTAQPTAEQLISQIKGLSLLSMLINDSVTELKT